MVIIIKDMHTRMSFSRCNRAQMLNFSKCDNQQHVTGTKASNYKFSYRLSSSLVCLPLFLSNSAAAAAAHPFYIYWEFVNELRRGLCMYDRVCMCRHSLDKPVVRWTCMFAHFHAGREISRIKRADNSQIRNF